MVASRISLNIPGNNDVDIQLTEFVKLCLGPDVKVNPQDVNAFKDSISPQIYYVLAKANPDLLLRCFFPQAQLSASIIEFLKLSEIVFRSEEWIYNYEDGIAETLYEIKIGFLELFLLVYYGIYFHRASINDINTAGNWLNLGEYFSDQYLPTGNLANPKYDIKIIPPRITDFSFILELLPQIALIAGSFHIANLEQRLYPIDIGKHDNLEMKIQHALASLPEEVCKIIKLTYAKFNSLQQESFEYPFHSSSSPSFYLLEVAETKPESVNYVYTTTNIIEDFHPELEALFQIKNSVVTITNPCNNNLSLSSSSSSSPPALDDNKILKTLFNLFFNISLFFLAKENFLLESYSIYKPLTPKEDSSTPLGFWIANMLFNTNTQPLNEKIEEFLHTSFKIINARATSNWSYDVDKCEISTGNWVNLFDCKVITEKLLPVLKKYNTYKDIHQLQESLTDQQSELMLNNLISNATSFCDPFQGIYLRKINFPSIPKYRDLLAEELNFNASGHTPLLKIRTATRVINGIPVRLPGNNLQDCSGIVILASRGNIPIAAFKRQTPSTIFQNIKDQLFGFPTVVKKFQRLSSGKALLNQGELFRSLISIHLRYENRFYDMSRKNFLAMCFMRYAVKYSRDLPNQTEMLKPEAIVELRQYISKELDYALNKTYSFIHMYYMSLFETIVDEARINSSTLIQTLNFRRQLAVSNKLVQQNLNTPQRSSFKFPHQHESPVSHIRSYQNMDVKSVYQPNETFLQGIRLINRNALSADTFTCDMLNYNLYDYIHLNLLLRFGNVPAVYANVKKANGEFNIQGIYEAILIHNYILSYFGQSLNFLTYAEETGEFQIYSSELFRSNYQVTPQQMDENEIINYVYQCLLNHNATINTASPFSVVSTVTSLNTAPSTPVSSQRYTNLHHSASAGTLTEATTSPPIPSINLYQASATAPSMFDFTATEVPTPAASLDYSYTGINRNRHYRSSSLTSPGSVSSSIFSRQAATNDMITVANQITDTVPSLQPAQKRKRSRSSATTLASGNFNLFTPPTVATIVDMSGPNVHLANAYNPTISKQF